MAKVAALEWTDKKNAAWMDGSRLENQRVWCGRKKQGMAYHKPSKKDHQVRGPYGKESGGRKTPAPYRPRRNGGREDGIWDKGFGNKATPSSRKPNTTDGPGRGTTGQTQRSSTPSYVPSIERSCGSESGKTGDCKGCYPVE